MRPFTSLSSLKNYHFIPQEWQRQKREEGRMLELRAKCAERETERRDNSVSNNLYGNKTITRETEACHSPFSYLSSSLGLYEDQDSCACNRKVDLRGVKLDAQGSNGKLCKIYWHIFCQNVSWIFYTLESFIHLFMIMIFARNMDIKERIIWQNFKTSLFFKTSILMHT